jgi:hypothetical protein
LGLLPDVASLNPPPVLFELHLRRKARVGLTTKVIEPDASDG